MIRTNEIVPYQSLDKKSFSPLSNSIHIEKLNVTLKPGDEFILHFNNEILGVEEKRRFRALGKNSDKPKQNSVVLISHSNAWVVGKYTWQRQQGIDDQDEFFQVSVRGFSPKISFEIKPSDWDDFCPDAIEISAQGNYLAKLTLKSLLMISQLSQNVTQQDALLINCPMIASFIIVTLG